MPCGRRKIKIYCVRCRMKVPVDARRVKLSNGRKAYTGTCPFCGTKVFRMMG